MHHRFSQGLCHRGAIVCRASITNTSDNLAHIREMIIESASFDNNIIVKWRKDTVSEVRKCFLHDPLNVRRGRFDSSRHDCPGPHPETVSRGESKDRFAVLCTWNLMVSTVKINVANKV